MWRILIGLLSVAFVHAEERTAEDWAKELDSAYLKNSGYVATYFSENEKGGKLHITLGCHPISGISAAFVDMQTEQPQKIWFWTMGDDVIYVRKDNGQLAGTVAMRGMRSIIQAAARIEDAVRTDKKDRSNSDIKMKVMLDKDSFVVGPAAGTESTSPWNMEIKSGVIKASDEKTVTIEEGTKGDMVLSRKHGMLLSQSCPTSKEGVIRVLKLQQIEFTSSKEPIEKIFEGLENKALAEIEVGPTVAPHVFLGLTNIIRNTDRGFTDISLLEEACKKEADTLRTFANQCVGKTGGTWPTAEDWKKALASGKEGLRKEWTRTLPEGVAPDEKDFEIYLARADVREEFRAAFAEGLAAREGATTVAMNNLFKKQLVAETEAGKAAKQILETALTKAYVEAITDVKLKAFWSQREGLD